MSRPELTRNAVDVLPQGGLDEMLEKGRPLRIKFGIDVTSPDVHVGRGIPLQRLRAFQENGHVGVLIIGDYTSRIGDPSGHTRERPMLSGDEIDRNARLYVEQARTIIRDDPELLEVRYNGEWLSSLKLEGLLRLTGTTTVARLLERDDFAKRHGAGRSITFSEILYPLVQAYDSVAVRADVELGGTDQLFNLLAGREVMAAYGLEPQVVLTVPLLVSWDGAKMSSSAGNNIPLKAPPADMFARAMLIPDALLDHWFTLLIERPLPAIDPTSAKLQLAHWVVARSHGKEAADRAQEGYVPNNVPAAMSAPSR
ncbi:MAG TPA: tyrosine--tRNA ligase [Chloroflexi bacterium]|jgi:tyrosyl-tRNA synthetase|nr:tyrosine--tRNA ligase [Chloroflexota bacterium]